MCRRRQVEVSLEEGSMIGKGIYRRRKLKDFDRTYGSRGQAVLSSLMPIGWEIKSSRHAEPVEYKGN